MTTVSPSDVSSTHRTRVIARLICAAAWGLVAATGCTGATTPGAPSPKPAIVVANGDRTLEFSQIPERAIVTGQGAAETLVALGQGDRIVGMYYGKQFPTLPEYEAALSKIQAVSETAPPSKEVALALDPDFVVAQFPTSDLDPSRGASSRADFEGAGAPVFQYTATSGDPGAATFEMFLDDVEALGKIFKVEDRAAELVADARERLRRVQEEFAGRPKVKVAIVFSASDQGLGIFGAGMLNDLLERAGAENVYASEPATLMQVSREDFAAQDIEVYILPHFEVPGREASTSFAWLALNFPRVPASRKNRYIAVGVEKLNVGFGNVDAVEQIAREAHAPPIEDDSFDGGRQAGEGSTP